MTFLKNVLIENDLEEEFKLLTLREQQVLTLYYLAGFYDEEIAKYYGVKRQIINRLRIKGINKLKKYKKVFLG
ncbi:MAG: hypothetical protein KAH35_05165 [Candidatus Atribacteria bacterium]|nr:hypothetical protein [Candidatus Atribacteria bacterium]